MQQRNRDVTKNRFAFLFKPIDAASLGVFRIYLGIVLLALVIKHFRIDLIYRNYVLPKVFFTYPFFDFVKPWSEAGMNYHFLFLGLVSIMVSLGFLFRISCALLFLAFAYIFLLDMTLYQNHYYLVILLSFLMIFSGANRFASLDALLFRKNSRRTIPAWHLYMVQATFVLVYFYGGIAKINPDWLGGEPLRMWLHERADYPLLGRLFTSELTIYFSVYVVMIFDLVVGFLLLFRKTRPAGMFGAVLFNSLNHCLFSIGIFAFLMIGSLLLFAEPDWPRKLLRFFRRSQKTAPDVSPAGSGAGESKCLPSRAKVRLVVSFLGLFFLVQILLPLRCLLYPGKSGWTMEGERFAWHMKLNDRRGRCTIKVTDPQSGKIYNFGIKHDPYLAYWQKKYVATQADLLLRYAHFMRDKMEANGLKNPIINVEAELSLNGRPSQPLIDPGLDLAKIRYNVFAHAGWIMPLKKGEGRR